LDALRDGFDFNLKPGEGHVLELLNAEVAQREDPWWLSGLLAIAHEHSVQQLALGARFFAVLVLDRDSLLIGAPYESLSVPVPFWTAARHGDPFTVRREQTNGWCNCRLHCWDQKRQLPCMTPGAGQATHSSGAKQDARNTLLLAVRRGRSGALRG
jgi:hypothetical protein